MSNEPLSDTETLDTRSQGTLLGNVLLATALHAMMFKRIYSCDYRIEASFVQSLEEVAQKYSDLAKAAHQIALENENQGMLNENLNPES